MHNDEPIIMGEVNMDDSSESGSDGEETPEDIAAFKESLKKADTHAQLRSSHHYFDMAQKEHHHKNKKHHHHKSKKAKHASNQGYLQFYDDNAVGVDQEEGEFAERVSLGSFDYKRLQDVKNQRKMNSFSNQLSMAQEMTEGFNNTMSLDGAEPQAAINQEVHQSTAQKEIGSEYVSSTFDNYNTQYSAPQSLS